MAQRYYRATPLPRVFDVMKRFDAVPTRAELSPHSFIILLSKAYLLVANISRKMLEIFCLFAGNRYGFRATHMRRCSRPRKRASQEIAIMLKLPRRRYKCRRRRARFYLQKTLRQIEMLLDTEFDCAASLLDHQPDMISFEGKFRNSSLMPVIFAGEIVPLR